MLSLTAHTQFPSSHHRVSCLNAPLFPTLISAGKSKKRGSQWQKSLIFGFQLAEERRAVKPGIYLQSSWCCSCHQGEGDVELEAEIMDFMAMSEKPSMFPTKEELMLAGRFDLVRAIKKRGGWYSLGWDVENVGDGAEETTHSDIADFQRRIESCKQSGSSNFFDEAIIRYRPQKLDSLQLAASNSQQPAVHEDYEDSGIDGILSRLGKKRNSDISGLKSVKNGYETHSKSKDESDDRCSDTSLGFAGTKHEANSRNMPAHHPKGTLDSSGDNIRHYTEPETNIRHYTEPETWRSWMNKRARFPLAEFEAAEVSLEKNPVDTNKESYLDGITVTTKEHAKDLDQDEEIDYKEVHTRLRCLEAELTAAVQSIKSTRVDSLHKKVTGSLSELQTLSDVVELQENEVMSAKQQLRSLRAKLAVVEGKMTLAKITSQKMAGVKQKHTEDSRKSLKDSRKSLKLLRTTSIVWPNSGAEVLLTGSFDGWATKRRMSRSKSGVFSITLKLYPGRYEIKFIVDGQWKLDPLRSIVKNNGHKNNLLLVS